jgi:hypothetical protein
MRFARQRERRRFETEPELSPRDDNIIRFPLSLTRAPRNRNVPALLDTVPNPPTLRVVDKDRER